MHASRCEREKYRCDTDLNVGKYQCNTDVNVGKYQ